MKFVDVYFSYNGFACVIMTRYFAVLRQADHYEANKNTSTLIGQFVIKLIPCNT